jgi:uncharacterized protein (TIGR02117 family)
MPDRQGSSRRDGHLRAVERRLFLGAAMAGAVLPIVSGCRSPRSWLLPQQSSFDAGAYLVASGWHTEIALAVRAVGPPLRRLVRDFPGAVYLLFGWGDRDYYMADDPSSGDALRALFPGPAVLLVTPLDRPPQDILLDAQVFGLELPAAGLEQLVDYMWASLDRSIDGQPRKVANGRRLGSIFYAATGTYSINFTCNTWSAEGLRVGGLPVTPTKTILASQVVDQIQALSARSLPIAQRLK